MTARGPDGEQPVGGEGRAYYRACAGCDAPCGCPLTCSDPSLHPMMCRCPTPSMPRPRPAEPTVDGLAELEALREMVRKLPRPTEAEQDAAALDYAQTALSEAWAALVEIRDWDSAAAERHGGIGVREYAAQYLEANGFQS